MNHILRLPRARRIALPPRPAWRRSLLTTSYSKGPTEVPSPRPCAQGPQPSLANSASTAAALTRVHDPAALRVHSIEVRGPHGRGVESAEAAAYVRRVRLQEQCTGEWASRAGRPEGRPRRHQLGK
jgi:hypothetical protein